MKRFTTVLFLALSFFATSLYAKPLKIGYSAWPGWFVWHVSETKGLFKKNGVDVKMVWYDDYVASIEDFSAGKIDANSQTLNDSLISAAAGKKLKVVLVNDNSTGNDQIIAKKEIKSVGDLKGKTVAAEAGTVDHFLLLVALQKVGLKEKDIRFKNMPTDKAADEFAKGNLDAVGVFAPFTTAALKTGKGHVLTDSGNFPGLIPDHLIFAEDIVKSRSEDVQKVVKTWFDTLDWISKNKAEATKIIAKKAGVTEAEYASYEKGTTIFSLKDNLAAFDKKNKEPTSLHKTGKEIIRYLKDNDFISRRVSLKKVLEPKYVKALSASAH